MTLDPPGEAVWIFPGLEAAVALPPSSVAGTSPRGLEQQAVGQLTAALDCVEACWACGMRPAAVLGHSFGELAALVACGSLTRPDAERLAAVRGRAMGELCDSATGLVAVIGALAEEVETAVHQLAAAGHQLIVTAWNSPTQTVVGGRLSALAALRAACPAPVRIRPVGPAVVAHSAAVEPVRRALAEAVASMPLSTPSVPIYWASVVTVSTTATTLRNALLASVTTPVRWRQAVVSALRDGHRAFCELGSVEGPRLLGPIAQTAAADDPASPPPLLWWVPRPSGRPLGQPFVTRRRRAQASETYGAGAGPERRAGESFDG